MRLDREILTKKIIQHTRGHMDVTDRSEMSSERVLSTRPTSLLESELATHPPPPFDRELDNADPGFPPPPLVDDRIEEDPPSPPLGPVTNNLDLGNLLDDQGDPPPGPDSDDGPPGSPDPGSDEDPLPGDSDEGPGSGSDDDNDPPPPSGSNDDNPPPPVDSDDDEAHITLEKMKIDARFIEMARESTLESQFTPAELRAFKNPQEIRSSPSDNPDLHFSLRFYISSLNHNSSQKAYADALLDVQERYPDSKMLSYDQVKRRVSDLSGVVTWKHDMCFNSCVAFTGPFGTLEVCVRATLPTTLPVS